MGIKVLDGGKRARLQVQRRRNQGLNKVHGTFAKSIAKDRAELKQVRLQVGHGGPLTKITLNMGVERGGRRQEGHGQHAVAT